MTRENINPDASAKKPICMILCGGTSRRFGSNKMLATLAGKPVLARTIERVRSQVFDLALNGEPEIYQDFDLPVLPDSVVGKLGPLAGILTAMEWALGLGHNRVLTVSGDTPFLPRDLAKTLSQASKTNIALPQVHGRSHQICGLWPTALAGALRVFLQAGDNYRVRDFLKQHNTTHVEFANVEVSNQLSIDPFFNINTRDDLDMALRFFKSE